MIPTLFWQLLTISSAWSQGSTVDSDNPSGPAREFSRTMTVEKHEVEVVVRDFSGLETYTCLRRPLYKDVRVVLMCFDISSYDSLDNTVEQWVHEADAYLRDVPKILVGCKKDRRDQDMESLDHAEKAQMVSPYKAGRIAHKIKALAYFETSALKRQGLDELFTYAAGFSMAKPMARKSLGFRRFLLRT
ncbi:GTP-binding protein rho3 precursor [Setomelanomma holmii]|uniref:GTP-binding protein rho3 n=1 Tax=Setomelanomma holmii TaxID=210430 RepID=A0A9P4HHQ3_9PLEO|nr:GTP-binding protein rho3 precursor [Setomelanomma holmii]